MKLRVVRGDHPGESLFLEKESFSIGRMGDNDYVISEGGVSRYHCILTRAGASWWLENKSGNGTLLNGRRVEERTALNPGDEITVSECVLKFESEEVEAVPEAMESSEFSEDDDLVTEIKPSRGPLFAVLAVLALGVLCGIGYGGYRFLKGDVSESGGEAAEAERSGALVSEDSGDSVSEAGADSGSGKVKGGTRGESLLANAEGAVKAESISTGGTAVAEPPSAVEAVKAAVASVKDDEEEVDDDSKVQAAAVEDESSKVSGSRPKAVSGVFLVKSEPSEADVMFDGRHIGRTPVLLRDVTAGQHSLELTKEGYERLTRLVEYPGGELPEALKLVQKVGTVNVVTEPSGAVVREGRRIYGTTPLLITRLNAGRHELALERAGYAPQRVSVELTAAKGETVQVTLQRQLGTLEVYTAPGGCNVYLDNVLVGCTEVDEGKLLSLPLTLDNLVPGNCTIRVQHPGTGLYDSDTVVIPRGRGVVKKSYMWIPTHSLTLLDGRKVVGMVIKRSSDRIELMNASNKGESYLVGECAEVKELTVSEQKEMLKNRASLREPGGAAGQKSVLSITSEEFYLQAKSQAFQLQYKGRRLCITGDVSARFRNPKGIYVLQFGKQLRCMMASGISEDEIRSISEQTKQELPVSVRGDYEGADKDGVHVLRNCVLLPYAD